MHYHKREKKNISMIEEEPEVRKEEEDRISYLPDEILLHILSFLHIKSGARIRVLSKRWRSLSTSIPSVPSVVPTTLIHQCIFKVQCVRCIEEAKALYRGIRSAWMRKLYYYSREKFPVSSWECEKLTLMSGKLLHLPLTFQGLKSLVTLCLNRVVIKSEAISLLINTCDLLENLKVTDCIFCESRPRIFANESSRLRKLEIRFGCQKLDWLRKLEIRFGCKRLDWLEIDVPSLLFLTFSCGECVLSRSNFPCLCEADLRFCSRIEDLEGWRRRVSGLTYVRTLFATDWLLQNLEIIKC